MKLLHDTLLDIVKKKPNSPAVIHDGNITTYEELNSKVSCILDVINYYNLKLGDRIVIFSEKSVDVIATMHASLRLGVVYVPIDINGSLERMLKITNDCVAKLIFTTSECKHKIVQLGIDVNSIIVIGNNLDNRSWQKLSNSIDTTSVIRNISLDDLAYILYTSGSTGAPKGVCITHRNSMAFVEWAVETFNIISDDRLSSHAPFHFDLSVFDLYAAFLSGACVVIVPEIYAYSPSQLVDFIYNYQISIWYSVPSVLCIMLSLDKFNEKHLKNLHTILFAGEPFPIKHLKKLKNNFKFINMYNLFGPTETNVCTYYQVKEFLDENTRSLPIGKAACFNTIWARNNKGSICDVDEEGELIVQGPTVMEGYFGQDKLNDNIYATGDIVKQLKNGDFIYIGRTDDMLKVRGNRIERGEVESVLLSYPSIQSAAVVVKGEDEDKALHAYVVIERGFQKPSLLDLKKYLSRKLPKYMIIDYLHLVDNIPLGSTGKINYRKLEKL